MNKNRQNKALAAVLATSILVTGTFAWQSFSQFATNETITKGGIAGGRLHNYFNQTSTLDEADKVQQVFVENFGGEDSYYEDMTAPIFARVRMYEHLEIGAGAGVLSTETDADRFDAFLDKEVITVNSDADIEDKTTWDLYEYEDTSSPIRAYRDLVFADSSTDKIYYMPTFNQDYTSELADTNGSLEGEDGNRHNDGAYADHVAYNIDSTKTSAITYYDEVTASSNFTKDEDENEVTYTHTAKETGNNGTIMLMEDWVENPVIGDFWVYDTEGWFYWASPIEQGKATGLLLTGIDEVKTQDGTYTYYGVHVEGQFSNAGGWYDEDTTGLEGMYDSNMSEDALYMMDCVSDEMIVARDGLAQTVGMLGSDILAMEGQVATVELDGIEYYVLEADSAKKVYTVTTSEVEGETVETGTFAGTENAVLLWSADLVDVVDPDDIYKNYNTVKGYGNHQIKFHNTNDSTWSTSDMRNGVLVDWLASTPQAKSLALTTEVTTDGYYTTADQTVGNSEDINGTTYDAAYLLSQPEYLDYKINLDNRYKVATMNQFDGDDSFSAGQDYWLRSASSASSLRNVSASKGTFGSNGASLSATSTYGIGVRPALWVTL